MDVSDNEFSDSSSHSSISEEAAQESSYSSNSEDEESARLNLDNAGSAIRFNNIDKKTSEANEYPDLKQELNGLAEKDPTLKAMLEVKDGQIENEIKGKNSLVTNYELIKERNQGNSVLEQQVKKGFQSIYMEAMTSAFGEELDKLRHTEQIDTNRLELLIESLHAGAGVFTD
ncbi:Ribosome assembly protein 3 [Smittium mucronatum]|uniref:Ribosome assembly protein 3 n=1 Tax=Smittium mucronatum TaxID=133383 RepID=A0A1R0GWP0_9FUNG|nr:Ribosome assembly protein 3 [Smittium mucronatum]